MPCYELQALDFVSLSLPALHNLIVHHHPASCTLTYKLRSAFFGTRFNSSTSHVIFSPQSSEAPLFSTALCITPLGLNSVYNNCARAT
jgi:hypothetical protein